MMWRYAAIGALLALSSCASVHYVPCPTLTTYSKVDQKALAAELRLHPAPQTVRWVGDYIGLRDQVRACAGAIK
ncbi:hypothetical protein [Neokomagataea anthophila]|uniref:Uncharacterized protein n=1 Tax=Neokomagataea anthophila TaxID=2826925 RepID=A0ABS5E7Y5_9PROT|nr:hypothetical protein [Neokomagataea anthophila]MBR0560020.1 hypothetical protein [Neokomagataea anthophila]